MENNNFVFVGTIINKLELKKSSKGTDFVAISFFTDNRNVKKRDYTIFALDTKAREICNSYKKDDYCVIEGYSDTQIDDNNNCNTILYLSSIKAINREEVGNYYLELEGKRLKDYLLNPESEEDENDSVFDFDPSTSYDSTYKSPFNLNANTDSTDFAKSQKSAISDIPLVAKRGRGNSVKDLILDWKKNNPNGRKADCIRELELSKPTVLKWWDYKEEDEEQEM